MLGNHRLAQAISDAGWGEFARMLRYKQAWRQGAVETAERWYPSSQLCSVCGAHRTDLTLADRVFTCPNGHSLDRDLNAAVNLAAWAQAQQGDPRSPDLQAGGRATNARRRDGAGQHPTDAGETNPKDAGTDFHPASAA
jgi:putative transposase